MCGHCATFAWPCTGVAQRLEVTHVGAAKKLQNEISFNSTKATWRPHNPHLYATYWTCIYHQFRWNWHPTHNNLTFASCHTYKGHMIPLPGCRRNFKFLWLLSYAGYACRPHVHHRLHADASDHAATMCPIWGKCGAFMSRHAVEGLNQLPIGYQIPPLHLHLLSYWTVH